METLGSLMDKLSIETTRVKDMRGREVPQELIEKVENKINNLKSEINDYIGAAIRGDVPLEEPKFKIYKNEDASGDNLITVADAMSRLIEANQTLWNLEDKRRDKKNFTDQERLAAADEIGTWNRVRNDAMDAINSNLAAMISKK